MLKNAISTQDIGPTVLWALGVAPPIQFRGKVILETFPKPLPSDSAFDSWIYNWSFNRTSLALAAKNGEYTKIVSTVSSPSMAILSTNATESESDSEVICNSPRRASEKVSQLGWDVFVKILNPFLFLVAGYALGLGVRYSTLIRGRCTDRDLIQEYPHLTSTEEEEGEELGGLENSSDSLSV